MNDTKLIKEEAEDKMEDVSNVYTIIEGTEHKWEDFEENFDNLNKNIFAAMSQGI